jgi:hypothetical protein
VGLRIVLLRLGFKTFLISDFDDDLGLDFG